MDGRVGDKQVRGRYISPEPLAHCNRPERRGDEEEPRTQRPSSLGLENPIVKRLPPLEDDKKASIRLSHVPKPRNAEFYSAPLHYRLNALLDAEETYVALSDCVAAYRALRCLMEKGYQHRNPLLPEVQTFVYAVAQVKDSDWQAGRAERLLARLNPSGGGALGLTIEGPSGIGKTSFSDRLYRIFKGYRPIIHEEMAGEPCRLEQLPIIRVSFTGNGLKDVCSDILEQADVVLGTDYSSIGRRASTPLWRYVSRLHRMATSHFLGALLLDDIQRLERSKALTDATLCLFAHFMQATGVPTVFLGTHKTSRILGAPLHLQEGAKFMACGLRTLNRLPPDEEWASLNKALWRYRISHPTLPMPDWLPLKTHWYAQGIPRFLRQLLFEVFERLARGAALSEELIASSTEVALAPNYGAIAALQCVSQGLKLEPMVARAYEHFLPPEEKNWAKMPRKYLALTKGETDEKNAPAEAVHAENRPKPSEPKSRKRTKKSTSLKVAKGPTGEQDSAIERVSSAADPYEEARKLGWTTTGREGTKIMNVPPTLPEESIHGFACRIAGAMVPSPFAYFHAKGETDEENAPAEAVHAENHPKPSEPKSRKRTKKSTSLKVAKGPTGEQDSAIERVSSAADPYEEARKLGWTTTGREGTKS